MCLSSLVEPTRDFGRSTAHLVRVGDLLKQVFHDRRNHGVGVAIGALGHREAVRLFHEVRRLAADQTWKLGRVDEGNWQSAVAATTLLQGTMTTAHLAPFRISRASPLWGSVDKLVPSE